MSIRECLKVLNLTDHADLVSFPVITVLSGLNHHALLDLREVLNEFKEAFLCQSAYCALTLSSDRGSPRYVMKEGHLPEEHPWTKLSDKGLLLELIFH
jgi:hypothetical protein